MEQLKQILWLPDRIELITEVPEYKIDRALATVFNTMDGKLGYAYRNVKQFTVAHPAMSTWRVDLKHILHKLNTDPTLSKVEIDQLRVERDALKKHIASFISFDATAFKQLRSNYYKLEKALKLLTAEGEITSYTLSPRGRLSINFFTDWTPLKYVVIEQGWTYSVFRDCPEVEITDVTDPNKQVSGVKYADIIERYKDEDKDALLPGTVVAKKYENKGGTGELHPGVLAYNRPACRPVRNDGKGALLVKPPEDRIKEKTIVDDSSIDINQWREQRQLNYIIVMHGAGMYWAFQQQLYNKYNEVNDQLKELERKVNCYV
jgi:hypothetical protein